MKENESPHTHSHTHIAAHHSIFLLKNYGRFQKGSEPTICLFDGDDEEVIIFSIRTQSTSYDFQIHLY